MRERRNKGRRERLSSSRLFSRRKKFLSRGDARREETEDVMGERRRHREREKRERERDERRRGRLFLPPLPATEFPSRERERGEERETGEKKWGEEFNFPPPFARHTRACVQETVQKAEKGTEEFGDERRNERSGRRSLGEKERMGRKGGEDAEK